MKCIGDLNISPRKYFNRSRSQLDISSFAIFSRNLKYRDPRYDVTNEYDYFGKCSMKLKEKINLINVCVYAFDACAFDLYFHQRIRIRL